VLRADLTSAPDVCNAFPCGNRAPITFSSDTEEATFFLSREGMLSERRPDGSAVALAPASELKLPGRHSVENALAVLALTRAAGIEPERVAPFVRTYAPSAHRIELIAYHDGVRYINDSKATNADALRQAVLTVMEKRQKPAILLIAGGVDKGLDFEELTPLLKATVKEIFLIGTCRHRLAKQWGDVVSCKVFASLEAAFESAAESACVGDVVMLSPGCASQDMFRNYAHRGDVFRSLVERRIGE
jgi:UDP-N-acetylmuramoylalanine--D-glutamate ligase